ncbi:ArsR/SmtB family transcription factor [Halovenus rubra]|uniref:ArsR/SmtB family transcription factor n=2 Tax=Halovenus rubra TaxID=869890 RepID=A0ACC7E4Y1_9EURY|nr:winged helix-turn-helix domain-containing protein [Halovenus rubra]
MCGENNPEEIAASFSALANPVRVRILLALAETRQSNWDHRGMSYSDLRSAVNIGDGGRFNYHLNELRGSFLRSDDGNYSLTSAGSRVVDEIYAETFSGKERRVSETVNWTCPSDGEQLEATFENGVITVSCPTHGVLFDMWLPLGIAHGRDLDELFAWANRRALWYLESVSWDVCPHCAGSFNTPVIDTACVEENQPELLEDEQESVVTGCRVPPVQCLVSYSSVPVRAYSAADHRVSP